MYTSPTPSSLLRRIARPALVLGCLTSFAIRSDAVQTQSHVNEGYDTFAAGELEGAALHWDGTLGTGPTLANPVRLSNASVIWDMAAASDGAIYAATGGPGGVVRIDPETGATKTVLDPGKPLLRAIHLDGEDNLYAGSSPDGRIHRIPSNGSFPEMIVDLDSSYIWSIQADPLNHGALLVASGAPGRIYRLPAGFTPDEEPEVVVRSEATHLSAFAYGSDETLYYATGPYGHLYRKQTDEKPEILAELGRAEVRSIFPGEDGSVRIVAYRNPASGGSGDENLPDGIPSGIFEIGKDGFIEQLWAKNGEKAYAAARQNGDLLIGSDQKGRLYRFENRFEWSLLTESRFGGEISAILRIDDDHAWIASSNPAVLYKLSYDPSQKGVYTSDIEDARQKVRWGALIPAGVELDEITWETRTGNRAEPDESWEEWKPLADRKIASGAGRFFQFRSTFEKPSAAVRRVEVFYQLPNEAPVFRRVKGLPIRLEMIPKPPEPPQRSTLQQFFANDENHRSNGPNGSSQPFVVYEDPGWLSIVWEAVDPNQDELRFRVFLRMLDDEEWLLMAEDLENPFLSMNVAGFDSGYYEPRIIANDRMSNPKGTEKTAETRGALILIDNEDPRIIPPTPDNPYEFSVRDNFSIITEVSYRIDGGEKRALLPQRQIFDSRNLSFTLPRNNLASGSTLSIEAVDARGNRAAWSGRVVIPEEEED